MAAIAAAEQAGPVMLLEKGPRLGRKLLLTGNGRCNLTNNLPLRRFTDTCGPGARFLRNALGRFSNSDTIVFFASRGLPLQLEQDRLFFPRNGGAAAVLAVLERELAARGVAITTGAAVSRIERAGDGFEVCAGIRQVSGVPGDHRHGRQIVSRYRFQRLRV